MTDKHIFYDYEGQTLRIPVEEQKEFEKNVPSAKMQLTYEGHNLSVPISELKTFVKDVGKDNVTYSVYNDKNEYQPDASTDKYLSYEKPSWGESLVKGTGSSVVGAASGLFDKFLQGVSGFQYYHPLTNQTIKAEEFYDKEMQNPDSDIAKASKALRDTTERLSKEADPTGGEMGFVDLIKDGKFGTAMQKGLATMAESSVQTLSAANPYLATLNFLSMWGRNYAEQLEENPDIPRWKRNAYAVGNAAIEQAVEKYADPIFKYVGGKGGAGELTEEIAKEIIEKATKDGVQTLTNRIVRLLSNTGKDMLSEGTEEIITSGGGDILGGVLDAISGDKEYGIKAQWEEYKKANPNATKAEFARDKSKEYIDAFIGGAISAGYMSGTAQAYKESKGAIAQSNVNKSRELGSQLDLNNSYDVNEKVKEVTNTAIEAFKEEGKPAISNEFFEGLTSDEAFALSESDDITPAQKAALENIANAKAMQEGLDAKLDSRVNDFIDKQTAIVNEASEDGSVIIGNYNGTGVFVKGGVIENGAIKLPDGNNGPVIVINMTTGEKTAVQSNEIAGASSFSSDEYVNGMAQNYRDMDSKSREEARNTMSPMAKLVAVQPYVGKKILVDLGNGIVEVYVQQITDNGEVTLKGKKGDLGGQSIVTLNSGTFYDSIHRDDTGNPVITEVNESEAEGLNKKEEEPVSEPVQPESANAGPVDYREQIVTILINGKPVQVEVTGQDNTSDSITYEYTDENGNRRSGGSSIEAFEAAITTPVETEPEVPSEEPVAEVEPEAPAEVPVTPDVINWDALLENEPDAYFAEMQKRFGNKTANRINAVITVLQREIDSLNKANPTTQEEIFENEDRKEALQAKIDSLNGMIERLNAPAETAPEAATEPVSDTPVEEAPVADAEPVVETPVAEKPVAEEEPTPTVEEQPVAEQPVVEQTPEPAVEPAPVVPVSPTPVANPVDAALKREESLRKQLERKEIDKNQRRDMAYNAGKAIADMFATREEYGAYEAVAESLGEFDEDFERGVNDSFANRKENQNTGKSGENSVSLGTEPKEEQNGKQTEQAQGEDTIRQGDDAVGRGSNDGGTETTDTGNKETEQELGKSESESSEQVKKEYPVRKGNATRKILEDTFGFAKVSIPNTESTVLNTVYDFMMEMAKMLCVSPNVIGNGGWLDVANLRSNANASAAYVWKNRPDGTIVEPRLKLKYGRISSIAHEWWHSLDHVLKYFNTGKAHSTATHNINLLESFGVRTEVREALTAVLKSMKDSGFESRISSMKLPLSFKFYLLENEEMTARAFDAYINDKFADAGIEVENAVYERTAYQPTLEEMEVIAPAFDNLFKVLKEKEGKKAGTSVLYHISKEIDENTEVKRELGELVADWIKMGGNFVVMSSTEMQQALEREGLVQSAKRPRRTILNSHLTTAEKQRIQKYILSLPMGDVRDRPYILMTRNYAYVFNTFRALYEENTTQHPIGDGFEILHKVNIRGLSAEQKKELQRNYEYDADRENINGWLQTSGALLRGLPVSVSDSSNTTTGDGYDSMATREHREETRADGVDNSSLRNTGEVQKLETPDGIIYGFVKDGIVYLDPSLLNPNTAIHEYTHLWDNALMQLNRPLWERGKALMKQLDIWNEVINDPNYSNIKDNEDLVASEVHSRLVGKNGEELLNQLEQEARSESITSSAKKLYILGRIREWLNETTQWLKDSFARWTKPELEALTLNDFLNMPVRDLVNFTKLPKTNGIETKEEVKDEIKSADPVTYDDNGNVISLSERFNDEVEDIRYNIILDPDTVSQETAKQSYDKSVNNAWQEFQRQFQDAYQPVRIAFDAIQQETGNIPIEDYENYLLIQNQSSSRSRVEIDTFSRRYYSPIIDQTNKIIDQILKSRNLDVEDKNNRADVYKEVLHYLIAKHGLERNEYYQTHKKRLMTADEQRPFLDEVKKEYDDRVNQINSDTTLTEAERKLQLRDAADEYDALVTEIKTREVPYMRDYSGLTALYGLDSKEFKQAEDEARKEIAKFESIAKTDDLWTKINAATNRTLKHSYESGMISRKQYEEISKMFNFYIPLRGFDENTAEDVYSYARFEGNRFNPAVQKAKGRTSLADDPIATIMNMAESEIAQGNKNKAKQALYNYILNRPIIGADGKQMQNTLMQVEDVWYVVSKDENGNDIHQIAAPDHEGGETYEAFENKMKALAKDGKAYKSKKGGVDVGMRFQKPANRNAHYVYLKINGVDKAIYINGDPKAADAINGTYKQKPLPKAKIKIGDREISVDLGAIQRNISSTFTNYSLEFTARNFFRDMFYSHINIDIKESDPEYRKKFRQNWRNNIFSMLPMLKAYRAGEFDNRALTEDEAAFVEFMENGGQTGYTVINSVEARKIELENAIKRMQEGVEKGGLKDSTIFKATFGGVELLNEASELITRFAAYKTSRDMGRSVVKSINDAKEITVNFNTKGAQDGTGFFGRIAKYLGWSKYFFNASVQGVQNIAGMAKANQLKFCTTVGTVFATGFMMPVIISAISAMLGGDDEEEYWNIPEYDRQNNFCIPLGNGKYAKIPLPIGFREVYAMGDMVAAMAFDKKFSRDAQQIGLDMANKVASIVLPINPLESSVNGLNIWASIGTVLAPSSAQFLIQNATNTDWKGAPLQKEYTYNENDPQWMKAYASNPLWMKSLSRWCNENINIGMKGLDWSPEKLDNTLSNLLGGVYSLIKKSGRSISMIWNEENRNLSNVPLAGVVTGSGIDSDDRFVTDAYFEMKEYYDDRISFIKKRAEKFGYDLEEVFLKEKGKHHPKMQDIYNNYNFNFMQEWYKGNEELKELQNAVKKIEKQIAEKNNPSEALINKLLKAKMELEQERREFVNDMLEFD